MDATGTNEGSPERRDPRPDRHGRPRRHLRTMLLAMGLVGLVLGSQPTSAGATREAGSRFTYVNLTSDQVRIARWAAGLFDRAGLDLPPIDFVRYTATDPCYGTAGTASYERGRGYIGICTPDAGGLEEFLFLHEMAHTWDHHSLSGARRQAFVELRGLAGWRSPDLEWEERGSEQAAEIMVWGLIDRPVWIVRIPDHSCAELRAGYVTLTGRGPLHGYTDLCD
jgi:hypothetical protein